MVDFRYITAVPSNFNYEEALLKNQIYKTENKNLKLLIIVIGFCIAGVSVYLMNKELNKKTRNI
jgi:hypothetical protein